MTTMNFEEKLQKTTKNPLNVQNENYWLSFISRRYEAYFENYLKNEKKCLGLDREKFLKVMHDNVINRKIDLLKNMNKHLENCEYKPIECSKCKELVFKHFMDKHLAESCPMRNVKCEHCQKWMPLEKLEKIILNTDQDDLCEKLLGFCPNDCSNKAKVLLRNHLATCKNRPLDCPYSEFGCETRFSSPDINKHLIDEIFNHSTSLIINLKNEISALKEMCNNSSKECKSLMDENKILKEEISALKEMCNNLLDLYYYHSILLTIFTNLNEMSNNLSKEYNSLMDEEKILKEDISKLQQGSNFHNNFVHCNSTSLITNFKNEISALKEMFNNSSKECKSLMDENKIMKEEQGSSRPSRATASIMRNRDSIVIHRNGTYIWKIEKFQSLKLSAENGEKLSVTSEPFYTKEFGYKMSMNIYPAGDGVGKGTHLSVFFTLMRGDYDDLLPWPFMNKVTLTIMDQKNKTNDYSDTFKPDPRSTCYQQPIEEYNISRGNTKFITFDQLNETYLKKDSIFLQMHVSN